MLEKGTCKAFDKIYADDKATNDLSVNLTRLMFPYILFISLSALISGIQNTFSEYKLPAFIPVILNVAQSDVNDVRHRREMPFRRTVVRCKYTQLQVF